MYIYDVKHSFILQAVYLNLVMFFIPTAFMVFAYVSIGKTLGASVKDRRRLTGNRYLLQILSWTFLQNDFLLLIVLNKNNGQFSISNIPNFFQYSSGEAGQAVSQANERLRVSWTLPFSKSKSSRSSWNFSKFYHFLFIWRAILCWQVRFCELKQMVSGICWSIFWISCFDQVVKMLVTLLVVFLICWIPYLIVETLQAFDADFITKYFLKGYTKYEHPQEYS